MLTGLKRFLAACRCEPVDRPPVWLMRQAGRYLPEYRLLRARHGFVELCKTPELAVEASLQPWRRFGMDAVIPFSDILLVPEAMGCKLEFSEKEGVKLKAPADLAGLKPFEPSDLNFVGEAIRLLKAQLKDEVPVIGFAGGPFTLAAYILESSVVGRRSLVMQGREFSKTEPRLLNALLAKLTEAVIQHCKMQIDAGADVIQIFDTWAGELSREEFREWALPYLRDLVIGITAGKEVEGTKQEAGSKKQEDHASCLVPRASKYPPPIIIYSRNCRHILEDMAETGADVISIDSDTPMEEAIGRIGDKVAIQGNLDPKILLTTPGTVRRETSRLLSKIHGRPGHIINLGHGVLPTTPVECVEEFVKTIKSSPQMIAD